MAERGTVGTPGGVKSSLAKSAEGRDLDNQPSPMTAPSPDGVVDDGLDSALCEKNGISGAKLLAFEKALLKSRGEEYGRATMQRVLLGHLNALKADAATLLLKRNGSMNGHVDRYQAVLGEHLKGARLIDLNGNGEIDAEDLVFSKDALGRVDVRTVGSALRDRLRVESAIVDACYAMAAHPHFFVVTNQQFSDEYWVSQVGGSYFTVKKAAGVSPSTAVKDLFEHPSKYKFDCATAMVVVYYKAMLELLGPDDFDRVCADLRIGPWNYENTLAKLRISNGDGYEAAPTRFEAQLLPGDCAYIRNWEVSEQGRADGWQGENVFYLGHGLYYGHPFGIASKRKILEGLNKERRRGAKRSASLSTVRAVLQSEVLRLKTGGVGPG